MGPFNPNWLKAKIIASVEMNYYSDGRGGRTANPRIHFTDGSWITFSTHETESMDTGIDISYWKKQA